jgi:hypothetical protein
VKKKIKKAVKKAAKKTAPRPAAKPVKAVKKSVPPAARPKAAPRLSWLNKSGTTPQIDAYARKLRSFMAALADGIVDDLEVASQEQRLVKLMKEIEPQLDSALHGRITELLCELTAYDIMRLLHEMHTARPTSTFRG